MSKKYGRAVSVFAWLLAALTALACMPAATGQASVAHTDYRASGFTELQRL